ncbi:MAG: hypothetical protein MPW15_14050 [Candidatus Manganitrophus sp.]|nr:hypothetical protein [Candidatus Manganitrophus sp.]
MPGSELLLPPTQFPILGNSGAVGLFSLLHIALAGLTAGFIVLAPALEYLGIKDPFYTRLGRSLVRFVAVVFSISAVFAVVMVELFIGLFPVSTVTIFFNGSSRAFISESSFSSFTSGFFIPIGIDGKK